MLETDRLLLLQPELADAGRMLAYAIANRETLAEWEPLRQDAYYTIEFWRDQATLIADQVRMGTRAQFMLVERSDPDGPMIGQCTISNIIRGAFHAGYVGYSLDRGHWGKGLMREALARAVAYAFDELGLHRLMANYMPRNERSGRVLAALGFEVEGRARAYLLIGGRWEDHVMTAITNPRWAPRRERP